MPRISLKPGDSFTVGEDITIQFDRFTGGRSYFNVDDVDGDVSVARGAASEPAGEEIPDRLRKYASKIISDLSALDSSQSKELLGNFVSELFLSVAKQEHHEKRCQRQAEVMAAAKARGARLGAQRRALPENFEELRQAWQNGKISLKVAAEACGIPKSTFHEAARRAEMDAQQQSGEERKLPVKRGTKQAKEGAPAKSKGARPGRKPKVLPEDFEELRQAWRNKEMSLKVAAEACGVSQTTFYNAAVRAEVAASVAEAGYSFQI